jgi:ubiquitin-conjugating enzyme E2 Z
MTSVVSKNMLSNNLKRLLKDVRNIMKNPLTNHGIHYIHDNNDCTVGYALIIGPQETPYKNGFYFFKFDFPPAYPYEPPKVNYLTNGENVRFNPNLYRNGKVCLSVLNTWKGEGWTSCQNISSVLLTLVSHVFCKNPILNEPGVTKTHPSYKSYHEILNWANYKVAFYDVINKRSLPTSNYWNTFYVFIKEYITKNSKKIVDDLKILENASPPCWVKSGIYNMRNEINYTDLKLKIESLLIEQKLI